MLNTIEAYFFMTVPKLLGKKKKKKKNLKGILFCHIMYIPRPHTIPEESNPQYCACRMAFQFDAVPTELFRPVGTMTLLPSMSDSDAADLAIVSCVWCLSQLRQSLSLSLQAFQSESKALASLQQFATA